MSTVKFYVKWQDYAQVMKDIEESGVKYYPVRRSAMNGTAGYKFEVDDHPIVSFLILKHDLNTLNSDDPVLQ